MGFSILNIGVTGLNVAQTGLLTTGHNIANASTPGFTRQGIVQSSNAPQGTGAGFLGQGANVSTVRRIYSEYLNREVAAAHTSVAELDTYARQIAQIDDLLADPGAGLSPALQRFFTSVQEVAANPASIPARQAMLSGAQALVTRFNGVDARLREIGDGVNAQIGSTVDAINAIAGQIAQLNERIVIASASMQGQPPNDLLDQREQLIVDLNREIRVTTVTQDDGSLNVFVGSGQPMVVGSQLSRLAAVSDGFDPTRISVGLRLPSGATAQLADSLLQGGNLGGLLRFRSETLEPAQSALGRIAISLSATVNAQNRLGQDLTGALGGDIFAVSAPVVFARSGNSGAASVSARIVHSDYRVDYVASGAGNVYRVTRLSDGSAMGDFASLPQEVDGVRISLASGAPALGDAFVVKPAETGAARVAADSDNAGTAALSATESAVAALTTSDYRLLFDGAGYVLTRLADGFTQRLDALPKTVDGVSIAVSGTPGAGDSFLIQPARRGAQDLRMALTDARGIAAALPVRGMAGSANAGQAQMGEVSVLAADRLPLPGPVTLTFSGGSFSVAGAVPAVGAIPYASGEPIRFNGLSLTITGTPADGDTFTVSPNLSGIADNRNALALGRLQTASLLEGNTANYQSAYSQFVSDVGNKARSTKVALQAQENLAQQAQSAQQSVSGVNLDEEAANLLRYQQAFQAAGRMIDIAGRLFDELLSIGR